MIPALRNEFNRRYTDAAYHDLCANLTRRCRTEIEFRIAETPCFFPESLLMEMANAGAELTHQLVDSPRYMELSSAAVPAQWNVPNESRHPLFMTVDFGLARGADGRLAPKLVELQAFPSVYGYQAALAEEYVRAYKLDRSLHCFLGGHTRESYWALLGRAILGKHAPENVVLLEIDPANQKTRADFYVTHDELKIPVIDLRDVTKQGSKLYYRDAAGKLVPIHRIYNRAIVDELERRHIQPPFDYRDALDVEWAGHPNWYFRISKFSLPYLEHPTVPRAIFLDELEAKRDLLPADRSQWILKPLYSFAGKGIQFEPTDADLAAIPASERHNYLVQERVRFEPVIQTPAGATQAEVRILYLWPEGETLQPVMTLVRMGRGLMMGVDHNRDQTWVGSSAALFP
jgi:hypothetical protein